MKPARRVQFKNSPPLRLDINSEFLVLRIPVVPTGGTRDPRLCAEPHPVRLHAGPSDPHGAESVSRTSRCCRDYAHLAIALCRCLNIPARSCTGYLGDAGTPPPHGLMDFAGWFEAFLGGQWHVFDPRNNVPRIGRILVARGHDAVDVAINTTFGSNTLLSFKVICDEVPQPN